jgi:hypothetical protein
MNADAGRGGSSEVVEGGTADARAGAPANSASSRWHDGIACSGMSDSTSFDRELLTETPRSVTSPVLNSSGSARPSGSASGPD